MATYLRKSPFEPRSSVCSTGTHGSVHCLEHRLTRQLPSHSLMNVWDVPWAGYHLAPIHPMTFGTRNRWYYQGSPVLGSGRIRLWPSTAMLAVLPQRGIGQCEPLGDWGMNEAILLTWALWKTHSKFFALTTVARSRTTQVGLGTCSTAPTRP